MEFIITFLGSNRFLSCSFLSLSLFTDELNTISDLASANRKEYLSFDNLINQLSILDNRLNQYSNNFRYYLFHNNT